MSETSGWVHSAGRVRTVFVTGATGLLGNNLVRQLVASGHHVRALVRSRDKAQRALAGLPVELVLGDMRDVPAFAPSLDGVDAVFHTAAYFREYYGPGDHEAEMMRINIDGTLALMREADARGVTHFVHTSSSGAVGMKPDGKPGDEDTPPEPDQLENGYVRSKVEGDARIRAFVPTRALRLIEILPGWMWGPGDLGPTAAGQLVLDFTRRKIPVIPDGGGIVVDARDVASAMITCLTRAEHGARYVVGGSYQTIETLLRELEVQTGIVGPRRRIPFALLLSIAWFEELRVRLFGGTLLMSLQGLKMMHRKHDVSSERARRELGVTFRPIAETVRDVLASYQAQGMVKLIKAPAQSRSASATA